MHEKSETHATNTPPVRGAQRNQQLADGEHTEKDILLPSLESGVTLLTVEGARGVPALQSLVVDHLLGTDGTALWVDADGHATTTTLARIAPSRRLLDRILVARGFTAYQHYAATCDLPAVGDRHEQAPSLVVVPALDAQYRADDTLGSDQARRLQTRTLAQLAGYAADHEIPVLVTCSGRDSFTDPVAAAADHRLRCEQTRMGPRFVGETFETLVYPVDDGRHYQTTLTYWRDLLAVRARAAGLSATTAPQQPTTESGVGTGVTTGGETAPLTPNPALDAWRAAGGEQ